MSTTPPAPTLHNTLGDVVPVVTDDQGNMRAVAPNGRLVVAAGQIIASAWGNTTYDQTMMTFASAADRTNQWPVVQDGSLSFLMDSRTPWIYRNGAWRGLPLGYVNSATGPASQTDFGALDNVVTFTFPVGTGRSYRVTAYCYGAIVTAATAAVNYRIRTVAPGVPATDVVFLDRRPAAVGDILTAGGVALLQATTTGTATAALQAASGAGGPVRVAANGGTLVVEDIGG